jgi:radical SAM superfamily enzyme YgiQ (UPF0313 family)
MKIKLFYPPRNYPMRHPLVPYLALPVLTAFLKKHNISRVKQDDLDIKVFYDNITNPKKKVNLDLFSDKERIINFIKKGEDPILEKEAEKILKKTNYKGADVYGFSFCSETNFVAISTTLVLAKIIKERTGAQIVLGGLEHSKPIPEISLVNLKYIDFLVLGNHFHAYDFLIGLEEGNLEERNIEGLIYKKLAFSSKNFTHMKNLSDVWVKSTVEEILPRPDFDGLPLELYKYPPKFLKKHFSEYFSWNKRILILPYQFLFGCPFNCIFCSNSESSLWKVKTPNLIVEELKYLSKRYKTKYFFFLNTNVNPTSKFTQELTKNLVEEDLNILFSDSANVVNLNKELLCKLKEAGGIKFVYGVECPSPRILKYVEKNISISKVEKVLRISHRLGIWNEISIIVGLPHEKIEDISYLIKFLLRNHKFLDRVYLNRFMLLRSKLFLNPEKYGITNIRPNVNSIADEKYFGWRFDEINGLKWQEKVKEINMRFNLIRKVINKLNCDKGDNLPLLFYLYSLLNKKKDIITYFQKLNGVEFNFYKTRNVVQGEMNEV